MERGSLAARAELVAAIGDWYRAGRRAEQSKIPDEVVAVTGYHKHAMGLLWPKIGDALLFNDGSIAGTERRCSKGTENRTFADERSGRVSRLGS
jgi:hypothetical protein